VGAAVFYLGRDYDSTPAPDATSAPAATPVTATPAAPSLTQLEEQAKAAFTAADYAKAAELWGQATAQKANDVDLLISYARALLLSGQFDAFPALAEKILSLASTPDQTLDGQLLLAGAQVYKGDLAAGTALYEKMLAERKDAKRDHRTILLEQGTTLWRTKHYDKALVTFQKALPVSEPDQRAGLWVNMALVYRDMGKIDGETNAYRRAYQDANAPPDVRAGAKIELALIDLRQGRVDKAKQQIAESVRENLNPGQVVTALRDVAKVLADKKRCDDIKPLYQPLLEALAKDPGPLNDARVDLANVLVTCGNSAEALSLYKQVATESTNKIQKDWATETAREMAASPPATTP
jgi:tetratricopeptide (TPR) repeat protein